MTPRPNVVVLCLDTVRPDVTGPERGTTTAAPWGSAHTPTLDRLAARSMRFPRAYAEFPLTVPFRTSLVTGTYTFPHRPWSGLRAHDRHVAELLGAAGYETVAFTDTPFRSDVGMHRGFETFCELPGKMAAPTGSHRGTTLEIDAWIPEGETSDRRRWERFRDGWYGEHRGRLGTIGIELMVDRTLDWLTTRRDDRPFLLWLDAFECHEPWLAPTTVARGVPHPERLLALPPGPSTAWLEEGDLDQIRRLYLDEVEWCDRQLGRLVAELESRGVLDESVVVVVSDHGVPLGEHGRIRKFDVPLYDEMARICWMTSLPGGAGAGAVSTALVQPPDLLATIVDLVGLTVPPPTAWGTDEGAPGGIEGRSLLPVLRGETDQVREAAHLGVFATRSAVVEWPWKYIDHRGERPDELFRLDQDPGELHDLVDVEPELAGHLHRRMWRFQHRWARALRA